MTGRIGVSKAGMAAILIALLALMLAVAVSGCGGDSSASGSSGNQNEAAKESTAQSEPSSQFFGKSAANQFAKFGKESNLAEREAAAAIVAKSLTARAAKDWAGQCATLSKAGVRAVEESPAALGQKGCVKDLKAQGENAPKAILENNLKGSVAALRVKGDRGYALYFGTDKKKWAMPMDKEGGVWKVGALVADELTY